MALTDLGIQYICINFGDSNNCCVKTGLTWKYTRGGETITENGGTAQVVSRLASGLVDSVTMISPNKGTFTKNDLDTANGQIVTFEDCQLITQHDEPSEDQWCYSENGTPPPPPPVEPDYLPWIVGGVLAGIIVVGVVYAKRKK